MSNGGNAGMVTVKATELQIYDKGLIGSDTFARGDLGGDAGTVMIEAGKLEIRKRSVISSNTFGTGDAGAITVEAGQLLIVGIPGANSFTTGISSRAGSKSSGGNAGMITVKADKLEISDRGVIGSDTFAMGDAGTVMVKADELEIHDQGAIASSSGMFAIGNAGTVTVEVDKLKIRDRGMIASNTLGVGNAGTIMVKADELEIRDQSSITSSSGIFAIGNAGTVTVEVDKLKIRDQGSITSSSRGPGRAGDVLVTAGTLLVDNAGIRTLGTDAEGGRITIAADDLIHLIDAEVTSNGIRLGERTSLIKLTASNIVLNNSIVTSLSQENQRLGDSGLAELDGDVTVISTDSLVAATTSVVTTGVQTDIGTGLQLSAGAFVDVGRLLRDSCAARGTQQRSSFTRANRGGLPPSPDRPLAATGTEAARQTAAADSTQLAKATESLDFCGGSPPGSRT